MNGGYLFAGLGLLNVFGFGMSLFMDKPNFQARVAHKGDYKFFSPVKSWCASDSLSNIAWTAPSLIFGGAYLSKKMGALKSLQFFGLAFMTCYMTQVAFGPRTAAAKFNIRPFMPFRFDCIEEKTESMVGADLMAASALYMMAAANGYWPVIFAAGLFDLAYYGPMMLGPAGAALFFGMAIL